MICLERKVGKPPEAQAINVGVQRAQFNTAIAVLMGVPPVTLWLGAGDLAQNRCHAVPARSPRNCSNDGRTLLPQSGHRNAKRVGSASTLPLASRTFSLSGAFWLGGIRRRFRSQVANEISAKVGATVADSVFNGGLRAQLTAK